MPGVGSVQSGAVTAAISRAAARTGVDFNYLVAEARIESGLNPQAQSPSSSARGLYQFVDSTWLRTVDRHGSDHGMQWAGDAISNGRVADPALRAQIMALRDNPDASALMAAELTNDNRDGLRASLGREPDNGELYLAHFLGLGGAQSFLAALATDPTRPAAALNPAAAGANRAIFFDGARPRSLGEVMELVRGKLAAASGDMPMDGFGGGTAAQLAGMRASFAPPSPLSVPAPADTAAPRPVSMAETLLATFGDDGGPASRAGAQVSAAYSKFKALSL